MKYRIVNVYTGYAENSIWRVTELEGDFDITVAAKLVEENNQNGIREDASDDGDELDEAYITEFFTGIQLVGDIAGVCNGEENTLLVIPATSVWYDRVMDEDVVYDNHMDEWNALIWGQQSAGAPSV